MSRCLQPKDLEALSSGGLSARRAATARRHIADCGKCAAALAEAEANEAWLAELRASRELGDLRGRVATNPTTQSTSVLTNPKADG